MDVGGVGGCDMWLEMVAVDRWRLPDGSNNLAAGPGVVVAGVEHSVGFPLLLGTVFECCTLVGEVVAAAAGFDAGHDDSCCPVAAGVAVPLG